ncbi:MAG: outer membrane protein assembly factor BamD [Candidatus Omnitrophica bacterium]|nr:outer membrane protein assembly factor BamD [Candidatus Omnitrophota bacterium]
MRSIIISALLFFLGLGLSFSPAYAYWIWTPKTNKWVNPKNTIKPTPTEQFEFAKGLYDAKNYEDAKREFKKLLKAYPKSKEAAESQYYLGRIEEEKGNLYEAYQAYQRVIDKYPFSERIQEIIEREYKIGDAFMSGEKRKAFGMVLPVDNPAIEIFTKVVENSTYGPLAPKAQYKLGLVLKSLMRYYEAEDAFNKVISNYPDSEWAAAAQFQIALCRSAVSRGPDYDQGASEEAKQRFEEFVKAHPDAVLSQQAEQNINQLNEKEAEANFNTAIFYEKQRAYGSARIYYNDIISNYPQSPWAKKAAERMQLIGKKK